MRVLEQTNHYYYYKYIIYNKRSKKKNPCYCTPLCYPTRTVLRYIHFVRVPEHPRTCWNTGTRMVLFLSLMLLFLLPFCRRGGAAVTG